jgi:hypothetical protein
VQNIDLLQTFDHSARVRPWEEFWPAMEWVRGSDMQWSSFPILPDQDAPFTDLSLEDEYDKEGEDLTIE